MNPQTLIKRALVSPNQPNMLLYGAPGNVSYECFYDIISEIYPSLRLSEIDEGSFKYGRYLWYYEFSLHGIQKKNRDIFWRCFLEIIKTPSTSGKKRMIVFRDTHKLGGFLQDKMRVALEKYNSHNIFVVFTVNYTSLSDAFRSRFLSIRFPTSVTDNEITRKPADIICDSIMKIYDHDFREIRKCDIQDIKEICHNLLKYDIELPELCQTLTKRCFENPKWTAKIKTSIIKEITESESKLKESYRQMIHIETLLVSLYHITSFAHYEIDSDKEESVHILGDTAAPE